MTCVRFFMGSGSGCFIGVGGDGTVQRTSMLQQVGCMLVARIGILMERQNVTIISIGPILSGK